MIIEHIKLYNFRCYDFAELCPDPRFNVVFGLNGQGKTSVLEAVGLIAFLKSFRNAKNAEMVSIGQTEGSVSAVVRNNGLNAQFAVKLWQNRKQATFNGKTCKYLSEYVGKISAVSFSPTDLEIIKGSPEYRRLWVDKMSQIFDLGHADAVVRYQKILDQRNRQLKQFAEGKISALPEDFEVWTDELANWGAKIIHSRIHTVENSVDRIAKYYDEISGEKSDISIRYQTAIFEEDTCRQQNGSSLELIAQLLRERLLDSLRKDQILGTTTVGPHRDDIELKMAGNLVRSFASQGEVRSLVLAMRLSEVEIYKAVQQLNPILLIDDFSSELDARRRKFLLDYLEGADSQVFLSTTEELRIGKTFEVKVGNIFPLELRQDGRVKDGCQ